MATVRLEDRQSQTRESPDGLSLENRINASFWVFYCYLLYTTHLHGTKESLMHMLGRSDWMERKRVWSYYAWA